MTASMLFLLSGHAHAPTHRADCTRRPRSLLAVILCRQHVPVAPLLLAMSLGALAACGGWEDDSAQEGSKTDGPEDHVAQAMLLTLADFPIGWSERIAGNGEGASPYEECPSLTRERRTGYAKTGTFSRGDYPRFVHFVLIYEESPPNTVFKTWESHLRCRVEALNAGAVDDEDVEYRNAALGRTSFSLPGYRSESHRLSFWAESKDPSKSGIVVKLYYDVTMIQVGRSLVWVDSWTIRSPIDPDDVRRLSQIAISKAETELRTLGGAR